MQKKRGGQKKHWAEEARLSAWYQEIKCRCDWSDHELDNQFAWKASDKSTTERPRTFEWICKFSRKPSGRDPRWRNMEELLFAVDAHPLFIGIKSIYDSKFWDIVQIPSPSALQVREEIDLLFTENKLTRVVYGQSPSLDALRKHYTDERIFIKCLQLSLRNMDGFSPLALLWWLYLEAEVARNWGIRQIIESIADECLEDFFRAYFPQPFARNYYVKAFQTLLSTRVDLNDFINVYGAFEITSSKIIPNNLIGKISEQDLFKEVPLKDGINALF